MRFFGKICFAIAAVLFAVPPFAQSASYWTGNVGDSWNDPANWSDNLIPSLDQDAIFNSSVYLNSIAQLGGDQAIHGLTFNSDASTPITIAGGYTLSIGSGGITLADDTAAEHNINADIALLDTQTWSIGSGRNLTCNGNIFGNLPLGDSTFLYKAGEGTLTLGGANTFSGIISLSAGKLTLAHAQALQNSTLLMSPTDTGTLELTPGADYVLGGIQAARDLTIPANTTLSIGNRNLSDTCSGVISGDGNLTKIGTGTLILKQSNTFNGLTRISSGTLKVNPYALQNSTLDMQPGDTGILSPLSSTVTLGGLQGSRDLMLEGVTLAVGNNNTDTTYSGAFIGSVSIYLTKIGTGTLTLSGANTFSGITHIAAGKLSLANTYSLQNSILSLPINDAGTLDLVPGREYILGNILGVRDLTIPANTTLSIGNRNLPGNCIGVISGEGNLTKIGTNSLTLGMSTTFTGLTRIAAGSLQAYTNSLQNSTLDMRAGDTGVLAALSASVILGGLQGERDLPLYFSTISVGNNNEDTIYSGILIGSANSTLTKIGTGTLTLSGANAFSGTTRIAAGKLSLANPYALQNSSLILIKSENGTLDLVPGGEYILGGIQGDRDLTIPVNTTLSIGNRNQTDSFFGVIGGEGNLTKIGTGALTLGMNMTFTGLTRIAAGTLNASSNSLQNSTLDLQPGDTGILFTGSTVTLGGLQGSRDLMLGSVTLSVGNNNTNTTYSGALIGGTSTNLTKIGSGTLTLSGANTFSGMTRIAAGKLTLANSLALQNSFLNLIPSDTGTLDLAPGSNYILGGINANRDITIPANTTLSIGNRNVSATCIGVISGEGNLTKIGTSQLDLGLNTTFTGLTRIAAGTLRVHPNSLQYSTLDMRSGDTGTLSLFSSTLTLGGLQGERDLYPGVATLFVGNNNDDTTYSGALLGSSSTRLTKIGTGKLSLAGINTYLGPTDINAGVLEVDGSLNPGSAVLVHESGVLAGIGSLGPVLVAPNGCIAPGSSAPGVLTLGSLTLRSGSRLDFDLAAVGASDELLMANSVLYLGFQEFSDFSFRPLDGFGIGTYTLIDAGTIQGELGPNCNGNIAGFDATLSVSGNDLVLTVVPEPSTLALLLMACIGATGFAWNARKTNRRMP